MSFDLNRIDPRRAGAIDPVRSATPAPAAGAFDSTLRAATRADTLDVIPASPPPELRDQISAAQRAVQEMHARGRELHFQMADGRVHIELRDLDGNVLREIPPSEALEFAAGGRYE
ncbi:MAG: hypothetical protein QOH46_3108 [Solirubrobacteraceae bacterium]|jgi:hypothetical protein|nr:hypothetical protein [Solirubrobacteraceae bacterium]MEA2248579.1 hypothetical protein [Solirubrobacteraceae bacterium]